MQAPPALELGGTALFLDVDGTLVEIAGHPEKVVVPPDLPRLLEQLDRATGGALALVSGRPVEQLDQLFAPARVSVAGLHGLDLRNRTTGRIERSPPDADAYERAKARLTALCADDARLLLEEKRLTLALHYRNAPDLADEVRRAVEEVVRSSDGAFVLLAGKMVLELKPPGADKGDAIRAFMEEPPFAGRRPVFAGDDVTDEAGFEAVEAAGGVTIRVGADGRTTAARHGIADVPAMLAWLRRQLEGSDVGLAVA